MQNTMHRLLLILACLLLGSCTGDPGPTVLRLVGSDPGLSEVLSWKLDGARDNAQTRATAILKLAGGHSLQLDLRLSYDPTPVLAEGWWSMGSESGRIDAERVRFAGGQGEGPSVGGDFVLVDSRNLPRYRVTIPLTPIATPVPTP